MTSGSIIEPTPTSGAPGPWSSFAPLLGGQILR
jgi:hypothetical protein